MSDVLPKADLEVVAIGEIGSPQEGCWGHGRIVLAFFDLLLK